MTKCYIQITWQIARNITHKRITKMKVKLTSSFLSLGLSYKMNQLLSLQSHIYIVQNNINTTKWVTALLLCWGETILSFAFTLLRCRSKTTRRTKISHFPHRNIMSLILLFSVLLHHISGIPNNLETRLSYIIYNSNQTNMWYSLMFPQLIPKSRLLVAWTHARTHHTHTQHTHTKTPGYAYTLMS